MDRRELMKMYLTGIAGIIAGGWPFVPYMNYRRLMAGRIQARTESKQAMDWLNNPSLQRLCVAVRDDNLNELDRLVKEEKIDIDTQGERGITATAYAIEQGNVAAFERLLELGADPDRLRVWANATGRPKQRSLLEIIVLNEDSVKPELRRTKQLLLETALKHGADPNRVNPDDGTTPIFHATEGCLEILARSGADLNFYNSEGQTPLTDAAKNTVIPQVAKVIRLLELGADYRRMDRSGMTVTDYLVSVSQRNQGTRQAHPPERMALYQQALDFLKTKPDSLPLNKARNVGPAPGSDRQRFIKRRQEEFGLIPAPEKEGGKQ